MGRLYKYFISYKLAGNRNKSVRNRIVPIPYYIEENLVRGESNHNIFTDSVKAPNPDYFKTLWSHFKGVSHRIDKTKRSTPFVTLELLISLKGQKI